MAAVDMDADYKKALCVCVGLLTLKGVLNTFTLIRARLVNDEAYPALKEDDNPVMAFTFNYLFKAMFLVFPLGPPAEGRSPLSTGSSPKTSDVTASENQLISTCQACSRNSAENEPWFMAAAIVYGLLAVPKPWAYYVVYAYGVLRTLWWLVYLNHVPSPARTINFVGGQVCAIIMIILLLGSAKDM